ncbi:MAG TPA: 50S ribosomal protein L29 [Bacteroidales bacterium]|nr:MAG: 50S ribosomal protein L29 [Bacteroidetes bacterium GWE2_42_24]OFY29270.1 MAG: 50S ribosomal protein L29 [Bacteroidetes bacterium GWF2_43_11]PKP17224.1 MAG: 50S ribosomal protein L29 [Bacteroidetes bacterium HGW-Bacteroidetes-22]HBZ66739.1 50S ribosomal protein L29 [Bacteroidales bacterium]
MKQEVIKELSTNDLRERLEEEKTQLLRLKLNHAVSPIENPHQMREYKRTVARILTEMSKREKDAQSK